MMRYETPLRKHHERRAATDAGRGPVLESGERPGAASGHRLSGEVEYISYGPPDDAGLVTCEVPATFGPVEAEYAAIRRGAGVLDAPHRATIRIEGSDRHDFLDRMVTQVVAGMATGDVRPTFWLNRKGRIDADLLLVELGEEILVDLDVHQADAVVSSLDAFVFGEDVRITDATAELYRITLHGPAAPATLGAVGGGDGGAGGAGGAVDLPPRRAARLEIAGVPVVAARRDQTGDAGVELFVPRESVDTVWAALLAAPDVRPTGWFAFNTARIEAGTPLFNIDFGTTNLPHETGVLHDRVSFTKGCYLGQEIVARMESLGRPKQCLVGLRPAEDLLPVAGGQVFAPEDGGMGEQVGWVTSSTVSPMLGAVPIAFGLVKSVRAELGTELVVNAEGAQTKATVCSLAFWSKGS